MPIPHPTYPDHTPPHIVGIETVGLKKPPWSTQQRQRRNRANKASDYSVDQSTNRPESAIWTQCPRVDPSANRPKCPRLVLSANWPDRELSSQRVDHSVRELTSPQIDQSAIWFVCELTSNQALEYTWI